MEKPHIDKIEALKAQLSERNGQIKFIANTAMACKAVRTKQRSDTGSVTDDEGECGVLAQFATVVERSAAFMQLSPDSKVCNKPCGDDRGATETNQEAACKGCLREVNPSVTNFQPYC